MTINKLEDGAEGVSVKGTLTSTLASQTEDTVAWIMKWGAESADENTKMVEKLERLDGSIEAATKLYGEQYGQDYGNIRGTIETIGYGMAEGLNPDIVDMQVLFAGLQGGAFPDEYATIFRKFQFKFMEKSPEIQAHMLWFFELVGDYVVSKSSDLSIQTNPLKNILFSGKNIPYITWISGVIEGFEKNEAWMILLSESIRNAEAPQIGLKQFIRGLFDTKPEAMDEGDRVFLQTLYTEWPDEEATNKPNTIGKEDKKRRDEIAKKYVFEHSVRGSATSDEIAAANSFLELVLKQ